MQANQYLLFLIIFIFYSCQGQERTNIYSKWQTVTLDFQGPVTNEQAQENPFTDYRLDVLFKHKDTTILVPGYYAADGKAAGTSADSGNIWRVKFSPGLVGDWTYTAYFKNAKDIFLEDFSKEISGIYFDGEQGNFIVSDYNSEDTYTKGGRLAYVGKRYLQFLETGDYFLKGGPNSPENFLAYSEFDGTFASDSTKQFIKSYDSHIQDWKTGDPGWQNGKGKGIIGALNYIADQGMNAVYMLTMNIEGDGRDVWPYISPNQFDRFDCSKLDQWEIVFSHAQRLGILLHFVTQETENELLLDNGDTKYYRKLYYRELVARFSHHLRVTWNLGEENGPAFFTPNGQNDRQRKAMAKYLKTIDPYKHHLVVHTHAWESARDSIVDSLYQSPYIDGLSLQIDQRKLVHEQTARYIQKSKSAGRTWVSPMDEIGLYWMGAMPDKQDFDHDTLRQEVLWGHLMAGGPGVEWYFGYKFPPMDLDCEDWRSREQLWKQTAVALRFFQEHLPFHKMTVHNELIDQQDSYCFAKPEEIYCIYQKKKSDIQLNLKRDGVFIISCFNPKTGEKMAVAKLVSRNNVLTLPWPIDYQGLDLVTLVEFDK